MPAAWVLVLVLVRRIRAASEMPLTVGAIVSTRAVGTAGDDERGDLGDLDRPDDDEEGRRFPAGQLLLLSAVLGGGAEEEEEEDDALTPNGTKTARRLAETECIPTPSSSVGSSAAFRFRRCWSLLPPVGSERIGRGSGSGRGRACCCCCCCCRCS